MSRSSDIIRNEICIEYYMLRKKHDYSETILLAEGSIPNTASQPINYNISPRYNVVYINTKRW